MGQPLNAQYFLLKRIFYISAGRSSKSITAVLCQCALAQTGYFASMCLMSPPQQAPTVPLESAQVRECVFTPPYVHVCVRERQQQKQKYRGSLQLLCSGLCVNENVLEGKNVGR